MNKGLHYIILSNDQDISNYYEKGLQLPDGDFRVNDYIIVKMPNETLLGIHKLKVDNSGSIKLTDVKSRRLGGWKDAFKPLNPEQICAFDLCFDDSVPIKALVGMAGSGKTKIAVKFGLEKLRDEQINKLFFVRNPVAVGEEVGFFKGDKNTKLLNWNNPVRDNLEDNLETFEEMMMKGKLEVDIPALMKGRDIKNAWIVVDEAEDLSEQQLKMVGERVSEGSSIIFTGDLAQVTKRKYEMSNGLSRLFNLRGIPEFGCVELAEDVRSETSRIFATLY